VAAAAAGGGADEPGAADDTVYEAEGELLEDAAEFAEAPLDGTSRRRLLSGCGGCCLLRRLLAGVVIAACSLLLSLCSAVDATTPNSLPMLQMTACSSGS
jgi:hypothetical protein